MQYSQYTCIHQFYTATYDVIMGDEAQTILPLGIIAIGKEEADKTGGHSQADWFMATVMGSSGICLTAVMTPPKNLSLYATGSQNNPEAIVCLIEGMALSGISPPGLMAEKQLTEMFAAQYTQIHNMRAITTMKQRIYELTKVNPAIPKANIRLARESDMSFLPYWDGAYFKEAINRPTIIGDDPEIYRDIIRTNSVYIMEDNGVPVTMARISRELKNVCYISYVFTPSYFRRKGYATACSAALCQIGLDRSFAKVVLFTDLANAASNSIYQKIGFYPICESLQVAFEPK